jgi:hypothetical protein
MLYHHYYLNLLYGMPLRGSGKSVWPENKWNASAFG